YRLLVYSHRIARRSGADCESTGASDFCWTGQFAGRIAVPRLRARLFRTKDVALECGHLIGLDILRVPRFFGDHSNERGISAFAIHPLGGFDCGSSRGQSRRPGVERDTRRSHLSAFIGTVLNPEPEGHFTIGLAASVRPDLPRPAAGKTTPGKRALAA